MLFFCNIKIATWEYSSIIFASESIGKMVNISRNKNDFVVNDGTDAGTDDDNGVGTDDDNGVGTDESILTNKNYFEKVFFVSYTHNNVFI